MVRGWPTCVQVTPSGEMKPEKLLPVRSTRTQYGGAMGVNWLGPDFSYQIVLELAMLQTFGRPGGRRAVNDQYGVGLRYQLPLTHALLLRTDALYGFLEDANDIAGARVELRYKF